MLEAKADHLYGAGKHERDEGPKDNKSGWSAFLRH